MNEQQMNTRIPMATAGMAYLNADTHRSGLRRALVAVGVPARDRNRAVAAALEVYPIGRPGSYSHDQRLLDALIAAVDFLAAPSIVAASTVQG